MGAYSRILLPWDSQPQEVPEIDWGGLGAGVKMILMPVGGRLIDIANPAQLWTPAGNASVIATAKGVAATLDGNGDYWTSTGYANIVGAKGTYFQWVSRSGVYDANGPVWFSTNTGSISAFQNASISFNALAFGGGTITGATSVQNTRDTSMVFTGNTSAGSQRFYLNGVANGTPSGAALTAFVAGSKTFRFGNYAGGADWDADADILVAGFTDAVWTERQAAEFHANPWSLFTPRTIWVPVSAGGASPDGNASSAPASSTLTAPTATGSGSAQASTAPAGSTLTAPTATASASAQASGTLAGASLTAPTATATGTTAGNATATGAPAGLTLTAPTATATGSAQASGAPAGATLTAPTGTASSAGHATASGAFSGATLTAPTGTATGTAKAFAAFMAAVLTAPTATASNGEAPVVILGSLAGSRPANEMTRNSKQTATRANVQTATRNSKQTATR